MAPAARPPRRGGAGRARGPDRAARSTRPATGSSPPSTGRPAPSVAPRRSGGTSTPLGIEVRAGLHAGEVEQRGEDIGGIAVHIGARVGSLAGPGRPRVPDGEGPRGRIGDPVRGPGHPRPQGHRGRLADRTRSRTEERTDGQVHPRVHGRGRRRETPACRPASTTPARPGRCSPPRRPRIVRPRTWTFTVEGLVSSPTTWTWDEIHALPPSTYEGDIHCVTTWSKFGMTFTGVSVDTLLEVAAAAARRRRTCWRCSHTGYTTNLPLADVTGGKAWVAWEVDGEPLPGRPRRPGAAARAAPLLLEEREVGRRAAPARPRRARLLGAQRLPRPRRPLARAALPGRLTVTDAAAADVADRDGRRASATRRRRAKTFRLRARRAARPPRRASTTSCG